jgi:hypothetical protein
MPSWRGLKYAAQGQASAIGFVSLLNKSDLARLYEADKFRKRFRLRNALLVALR